ncbi:5'-nucleotidase domain-containing protein 1-like [Rhodnius prolixus]
MLFLKQVLSKVRIESKIKTMLAATNKFMLSDYDAIALDFDNTLVQYNLTNLFPLQYSTMTKYLIQKYNYQGLQTMMNLDDIDFIRRGLFMDFKGGNVLDISAEGLIMTASHGTKKLSKEEIISIYGEEMRWSLTDLFIKDKLALWEGEASLKTRTFLDYTDIIGTLVFAKTIDLFDEKIISDYSDVWPHLLNAIIDMYRLDSDFTRTVFSNVPHYVHKCDLKVTEVLKILKKNCKLLLITGSPPNLVSKIAEYALGAEWENFFHTIVFNAKKPAFFTTNNAPFLDINDHEIKLSFSQGHYMRGNWFELYKTLEQELGRPAKCVYLGDNVIQDVYATFVSISPIDSVAVIEEALTESLFPGEHPHQDYLKSNYWGSYFGETKKSTVMGDIIKKYSKLCVPSVTHLADKPIDYQHIPFWIAN